MSVSVRLPPKMDCNVPVALSFILHRLFWGASNKMPAQSAGYSISASPFTVLFLVTLAGAGDGMLRAVLPQTNLLLTVTPGLHCSNHITRA